MAERALLNSKPDAYGGIIVDSEALPQEIPAFAMRLSNSIAEWQQSGKRGVWLKIPIGLSHLIVVAADAGFRFHHAESDYVMMTKWLPTTEASTIPRYATYYVGCGGFVLNERNEVLVVMEKNGPAARMWWKMPGGAADPGEELHDAAKREVFEETGIRTEVVSLLCFRTAHEFQFGRSDVYFLFRLKPLTTEIKKCEKEIAECKWMPLAEFCNLPYYQGLWKGFQQIMQNDAGGQYAPWAFTALPAVVRKGTHVLYHSPSAKF